MQTSDSVENIFSRSWTLLTSNPVIILPAAIVGVVSAIIVYLVIAPMSLGAAAANDPTVALATAGRVAFAGSLLTIVGILGFLITQTYTVGMAGAAWGTGTTTLADGAAAFTRDSGRVLLTGLMLLVISIALLFLTLGLGVPVFFFFAIYTIPAVILRSLTPVDGLRMSFTFAIERLVPTLIIVVLLCVIAFAVGLLSAPLAFIPLLGPIVSEVIKQAVFAFATLVIVGEFLATPKIVTNPVPPA
jgi:hypothetical protein